MLCSCKPKKRAILNLQGLMGAQAYSTAKIMYMYPGWLDGGRACQHSIYLQDQQVFWETSHLEKWSRCNWLNNEDFVVGGEGQWWEMYALCRSDLFPISVISGWDSQGEGNCMETLANLLKELFHWNSARTGSIYIWKYIYILWYILSHEKMRHTVYMYCVLYTTSVIQGVTEATVGWDRWGDHELRWAYRHLETNG